MCKDIGFWTITVMIVSQVYFVGGNGNPMTVSPSVILILLMTFLDLPVMLQSAAETVAAGRKSEVVTE